MRDIAKRLARIERQREASKPLAPCLVILPNQDADARLAEFRRVRGCEPWRVIHVGLACARKDGEHGAV